MIELESLDLRTSIKVVGVGGGGGNALNTMIESGVRGVEFIAANTDAQALDQNLAPSKLQLGARLTKGRGAGADPETGRAAAIEDEDKITSALEGAEMVFVTAGMGGGTGTGAAPIIAQAARKLEALTVGVVTKPFAFEMKRRMKQAIVGIEELRKVVDALIVIPNERLLNVVSDATPALDAFRKVDQILVHAVQSISELVVVTGLINVDFADVRRVLKNRGMALMGTGRASGTKRTLDAADQAVRSPLLEDVTIEGATGVLINFTGGSNMSLLEVKEAADMIEDSANEDADVIFGLVIDPAMGDEVKVTVIATGFDSQEATQRKEAGLPSHRPAREPEAVRPAPPSRRVEEPRGDVVVGLDPRDEDELDIPTFLRRKAD